METSQESQLKTFLVERGEKRGTLNVTCPSPECGGKFVVARRWLDGHVSKDGGRLFGSASCPYCFKTSWRGGP